MKLSTKLVLAIGVALLSSVSFAEFTPYIGADLHWKSISMRGFNKQLFAKHAPAAGVYLGHQFNENVGLEGGMHFVKTRKGLNTTKLRAVHGTLILKTAITDDCCWHVLGGVGLSHLKHTVGQPAYRIDVSRAVARALGGVEYTMCEGLFWRTAFTWENSQSLHKKLHNIANSYGLSTGLRLMF